MEPQQDRRIIDAAAALLFERRDVQRHLVLRHRTELDRARSALALHERRRRRRAQR